jgi:hypothetical protein
MARLGLPIFREQIANEMTSMTPSCYKELAALMESDGLDLLRDMLDKDPGQFWDFFGRFADAHCQWSALPEGELAKINERFVTFLRERARLRSN